MNERISRILDLVATERLGQDDAVRLLEALSPKLTLSEQARPHVFGLLHAPDFGVQKVTELLVSRVSPRPQVVVGGRVVTDGIGRTFNLDELADRFGDLGERIGAAVDQALGSRRGPTGRGERAGTRLRVVVETAEGDEVRAHLPLALAEHAAKLLPPRVLKALDAEGISPDALTTMLMAGPPVGELLLIESADGGEISLKIE